MKMKMKTDGRNQSYKATQGLARDAEVKRRNLVKAERAAKKLRIKRLVKMGATHEQISKLVN